MINMTSKLVFICQEDDSTIVTASSVSDAKETPRGNWMGEMRRSMIEGERAQMTKSTFKVQTNKQQKMGLSVNHTLYRL